jgi:hypothetical protein
MEAFPFLFELFVRGLGHLKDCRAELTGARVVYQRPSFQPPLRDQNICWIKQLIRQVAVDSAWPPAGGKPGLCQKSGGNHPNG